MRDLVGDFRGLGRDGFLAAHPAPFLLHQTDQEIDASRDFRARAKRAERRATVLADNPLIEVDVAADVAGVLVFALLPRQGSPDPSRITIGRTKDNDVQLPYDKVSVLHATFDRRGGVWHVSDAGSTNGTFVANAPLAPHAPTPLVSGTVLRFATAEVVFHSTEGLYDYLAALASRRPRT